MTAMPMLTGHANPEKHGGSSRVGIFIEHRCICMPAYQIPEEREAHEKKSSRIILTGDFF
jgi:hypothetical protein